MATNDNLAIDTSVPIPESVRLAAAAADSLHQQAYQTQPAPEPQPEPQPAPEPVPQPDPPPVEPPPQPDPPAADSVVTPTHEQLQNDDWARRYNSMKGRWEHSQRTIGSLQEQLSELGDELVRTQAVIARPAAAADPAVARRPADLMTPKDREDYGDELIDFAQRAAKAAIAPELAALQEENNRLKKVVQRETSRTVAQTLDAEVPNWHEINRHPEFKRWLRLPDVYSRVVRGKLLNDASQAADAPRVVSFFKGFLAEAQATGLTDLLSPPEPPAPNAPPVRQAATSLEALAAPGRPRPATGGSPAAPADSKPIFTRAQISAFYSSAGRKSYEGREEDRKRDEAAIFAAQNDGRVRG